MIIVLIIVGSVAASLPLQISTAFALDGIRDRVKALEDMLLEVAEERAAKIPINENDFQ